jgi:ABC-type bacteriocin/lantibiotic exporter with double-glycine peptidase domain
VRYQSTPYNCGPAALQNALKALGKHVPQQKLAEIAGTTEAEGTDEYGLQRAILEYGFGFDPISCVEPRVAFARLYGALLMGRPVLLCVDRWSHWVTAVGIVGTRVLVVEPGGYPWTVRENGLLVLPKDRLCRRWWAARRVAGKQPPYYGIAIGGNNGL